MVHFFTDPYKDELIYSAIARYHYYIGNIDFKDTLEELFGKRSIIPSIEIGSNLAVLAKNLGGNYTGDQIIKRNTLFPFYASFLPQERKKEIINEIKNKDGQGIYTKLGIVAGSICKKEGIYYCPRCANKEIEKYGEPYIHREHQLQGIYICPHDGEELRKYTVNRMSASRIEFIRLDAKMINLKSNIRTINTKHYELLYRISKMAYTLLQLNTYGISKKDVLERYKNILNQKGLTTTSGKTVKQQELYEEFINFYGKDFLNTMESNITNDDEYNWLKVITRNLKRTVHPMRHIMFINFLTGDIEEFFNSIGMKYNPFGVGPWPCLNKITEHYGKEVVTELIVTEDFESRLPVGTFSCSCGFSYSRKGPDKCHEDRYRIGRIKSFGHVWEERLKEILEKDNLSLREATRVMKCDPKTIIKFDKSLGINCFQENSMRIAGKKEPSINPDLKKIESYKNSIRKAILDNPTVSRTAIRSICKKEYTYLYKHARDWLMENLPQRLQPKPNKNIIVDWHNRDIETVRLLKGKYQDFFKKEKPVRITKSLLGKTLGILANLEHNIDKLPKTEAYLAEILESVEDFQIRRCKKIISERLNNEETIKMWQIQRAAGIRGETFKKIEKQLEEYLNAKREFLYDEK